MDFPSSTTYSSSSTPPSEHHALVQESNRPTDLELIEQKILQIASECFNCSLKDFTLVRLGGYTNWNFSLEFSGKKYFFKSEGPSGVILCSSLRNEAICRLLLEAKNIAPKMICYDPDSSVMITEYIEEKKWDFNDDNIKRRYTALLRSLHGSSVQFPSVFCPFGTIKTYIAYAAIMDVELPWEKFDRLLPLLFNLEPTAFNSVKVPCHLDPQLANVLVTDEKMYFIDWEFAAMGDPYFDLASLSASEEFSDDAMQSLLGFYLERIPAIEEIRHLYRLRILADMRMCLICYLQSRIKISEADIYRGFAENFLHQCSNRLEKLSTAN